MYIQTNGDAFLIKKPKGFHQPLGFHGGSGKRGSNPRPSAWEADALPTELLPQISPQLAVAVALAKLEQISRFSKFFAIYRLFEGV